MCKAGNVLNLFRMHPFALFRDRSIGVIRAFSNSAHLLHFFSVNHIYIRICLFSRCEYTNFLRIYEMFGDSLLYKSLYIIIWHLLPAFTSDVLTVSLPAMPSFLIVELSPASMQYFRPRCDQVRRHGRTVHAEA